MCHLLRSGEFGPNHISMSHIGSHYYSNLLDTYKKNVGIYIGIQFNHLATHFKPAEQAVLAAGVMALREKMVLPKGTSILHIYPRVISHVVCLCCCLVLLLPALLMISFIIMIIFRDLRWPPHCLAFWLLLGSLATSQCSKK